MITGLLRYNERGRWEIFQPLGPARELTSGEVFEVKVEGMWQMYRMEHNGNDYYIVGSLKIEDAMEARIHL